METKEIDIPIISTSYQHQQRSSEKDLYSLGNSDHRNKNRTKWPKPNQNKNIHHVMKKGDLFNKSVVGLKIKYTQEATPGSSTRTSTPFKSEITTEYYQRFL